MTWCSASPLETKRFGFGVARAVCTSPVSADELLAEFTVSGADVLILRTLAEDRSLARDIARRGFVVVSADTLVYYDLDLADWNNQEARPDLVFRPAEPEEAPIVQSLTRLGFDGYAGHYSASSAFDPQSALEGYVEWADRFARGNIPLSRTILAIAGTDAAGFLSGQYSDPSQTDFELVLSAVHPDYKRHGIYTSAIGELTRQVKQEGARRVFVSTQVWNYPVQKAWSNLGFRIYNAVNTFHIWKR